MCPVPEQLQVVLGVDGGRGGVLCMGAGGDLAALAALAGAATAAVAPRSAEEVGEGRELAVAPSGDLEGFENCRVTYLDKKCELPRACNPDLR